MNVGDATPPDPDPELASAVFDLFELVPSAEADQGGVLYREVYGRRVAALGDIATRLGDVALAAACARIGHVVQRLDHDDQSAVCLDLLGNWPELVLAYVSENGSPATGAALLLFLRDERWPSPLADPELAAYAPWIAATDRSADEADQPDQAAERRVATPAAPSSRGMAGDATPLPSLDGLLALAEAAEDYAMLELLIRLQANQELTEVVSQSEELQILLGEAVVLAQQILDRQATAGARDRLLTLLSDDRLPEPLSVADRDLLADMFAAHDSQPMPPVETGTAETVAAEGAAGVPPTWGLQEVLDQESAPESLLKALKVELPAVQEALAEVLAIAADEGAEVYARREALDHYREQIVRLKLTAETMGLRSLGLVLAHLEQNLPLLDRGVLSSAQRDVLLPLVGAITGYLAAPNDLSACEGLTDVLAHRALPAPLSAAHALGLARALAALRVADDAESLPERQREAAPADVELSIPEDLNPELLDGLLQELPVHCADFSGAIQRIVSGEGQLSDVNAAKRAAHTLKGAANTVGIRGIANLTHQLEDVLVALSERQSLPRGALATMLMRAADCLEAMGEAVLGAGPVPDNAVTVLQEVLDWAHRFDRDDVSDDEQTAAGAATDKPARTDGEIRTGDVVGVPMMRVPVHAIEELLRLVSESIIGTSQVRDRLRGTVQQMVVLREQHKLFVRLAAELEELVDLRAVEAPRVGNPAHDDFDPLEFEHFSELHTVSRKLIEAATDARELRDGIDGSLQELNELIEVQDRLHRDNQEVVMRTRMVPVATIVSRLQRSVRQASRLLDKEVQLRVTGERTPIDGQVLIELADPLMHLLRNAVDHGIESQAERSRNGKPTAGGIDLSFAREGNSIVIRCQDDGAGLDLPSVRAAALERGLIGADQALSDEEQARLILQPGFTTRSQATQMSGRGVGLDVVNSCVLNMKGSVTLRSPPGRGLLVELRLPATLSSTHAFVIRLRQTLLAVSGHGIEDLQYVVPDQLRQIGEEVSCQLANSIYPLVDLHVLLKQADDRRAAPRSGFPVLIVRDDAGNRQAIRVQEILASRDFVLKAPGRYVPRLPGVVGMTIMGDGRVAPVIDLPDLIRARSALARGSERFGQRQANEPAREQRPTSSALVVDDSLSARRATAQVLKDAGYDVRTAIDGMEAVGILDKWIPTVIVTDLEMPRMNGLELISHARARESLRQTPIVMITSRSTEKHRRQAEAVGVDAYLTKPFSDEELLGEITRLTCSDHV